MIKRNLAFLIKDSVLYYKSIKLWTTKKSYLNAMSMYILLINMYLKEFIFIGLFYFKNKLGKTCLNYK